MSNIVTQSSDPAGSLQSDAVALAEFIKTHGPMLVLTGAGISTASGIPEYRDENGNWKHSKPVQYRDFMHSASVYQRYWARSSIGWQTMGHARPNGAHHALVQLEAGGYVNNLITQNVDQLHEQAGQQQIINLHGALGTVSCQQCNYQIARDQLQEEMQQQNPEWFAQHPTVEHTQKPDGDAEIADHIYAKFTAPVCPECCDKLKPDVVFFGETIPAVISKNALQAQQQSHALLIIGSSLTVFSGFRIARDFCRRERPVALLNKGKTRADELIDHRYAHDASVLLPLAVAQLM